jgi:hypothetical protein
MHARSRFGSDINAAAGPFTLPNAGMLMPLPGEYHGTDITGLTASQFLPLPGHHLGNVALGKFDLIDTLTGLFPWIAYGQEGFMNVNAMFPVLPTFGAVRGLSLYGGSALLINSNYKMPQTGFMALGTENVSTSWDIESSFDDGVLLLGFHRFIWGAPTDKIGHFTLLGYGSTKEQASNDPHDFVFIPGQGIASTQQEKPWGVAGFLYQDFWHAEGHPHRKAHFVIGGSGGPEDPQFVQWSVFGNVEASGLIEGRPADRMGVAAWYSGLSGTFTDLVSPAVDLQDTWGVELYYNGAINKWFHLSPDIQLAQNALEADDFAVILGLRAVLDF